MATATTATTARRHGTTRPPGSAARKTLPLLSGGVPGLGHLIEFTRDTIGMLFRAAKEHGEVVEFRVLHKRFIMLTGPEAAEAFYRAPDEQLSPSDAYKLMVPVFGKDVVYDAPPDRMHEQMQMLMPALRDKRMRTYSELITQEVEDALASWGDAGEVDLVEFFAVLTNYTSSRCLLGREFREDMTEEFAAVYRDLEKGVLPIGYLHPYLPIPAFWARDRARKKLQGMIKTIAEARRREGRTGQDFLQTLMDARYKDGTPLSEHEITGLLLAAMFAGHHTSSVTSAFLVLELLQHPDYLDRCLKELEGVLGPDGPVTYQALRELPQLEWAVKETLRLHPPLFMLLRAALKDFEYDGYHIPAGSYVVSSPTVSHQLGRVFREPSRFDPERFGPGREEDKQAFCYISFGAGRHKCLGNAFALLQIKTIFAILLRRYRFELVGDPLGSDFHGLVVGPKQPARVRYRRIG